MKPFKKPKVNGILPFNKWHQVTQLNLGPISVAIGVKLTAAGNSRESSRSESEAAKASEA